jgi:hypothetical protein
MLSDLLGAAALGLRNLLLITGDPPKMGPIPTRRRFSTSTPSGSRISWRTSTAGSTRGERDRRADALRVGVG